MEFSQRRRRVFVVGCLGSWQRAAAVLFERESLQRDTGACRQTWESPAAATENGTAFRMRGFGDYTEDKVGSALKARDYKDTADLVVCINGNIIGKNPEGGSGGNGMGAIQDGTAYTLTASDRHAVAYGLAVRRLTPTECERLQGFPDGHTRIQWRGKPAEQCPDTHRYKAIGNSMAVPVMRWIGERINHVSAIKE